MKDNEYTETEKLDEMGLMEPSFEELGMSEYDYYGPDYESSNFFIELHPNERYKDLEETMLNLTKDLIVEIVGVDLDVFESHQNYNSALHVAKQIAKEINNVIQRAYFNGEDSFSEDASYDFDVNGTYHKAYQFNGTYSKITGEAILAKFGIYDDSYYQN